MQRLFTPNLPAPSIELSYSVSQRPGFFLRETSYVRYVTLPYAQRATAQKHGMNRKEVSGSDIDVELYTLARGGSRVPRLALPA